MHPLNVSDQVNSILKKGKKSGFALLYNEYLKTGDFKLLDQVLDTLLNHESVVDDNAISWLKYIIASGQSFHSFAREVKKYDPSTTCGLVWTNNFIAYRCRTCSISPCMSLCAACFKKGNHEGHDFNMFKSQAGGACDCGDENVMKSIGFCAEHSSGKQEISAPPDKLLSMAKIVVPKLLRRLIMDLRSNTEQVLNPVKYFIKQLLSSLNEMGAEMRRVIAQALIDRDLYQRLVTDYYDNEDLMNRSSIRRKLRNYNKAKQQMNNFMPALNFYKYKDRSMMKAFDKEFIHQTFVEELLFWTIRYEFPQELVCFLLSILPDQAYKIEFAEAFINHYSRIAMMLAKKRNNSEDSSSSDNQDSSYDLLANCVVHASVQLFSNEILVTRLCERNHLLEIVIASLRATFERPSSNDDYEGILMNSCIQDKLKNKHMVIRCDHYIVKKHVFWPLVSDLNNILTHKFAAVMFLKSVDLLDLWLQFILIFQGMNLNIRELSSHVEYENNSYLAAFSTELEVCATPMWTLLCHLRDEKTVELTKAMITHSQLFIEEWFDLINFTSTDTPTINQATFHIPLHRYYSSFLQHGVQYQGLSITDLLPSSEEKLKTYLAHPLQVQINFYEILSNMWVRNGLQMKGQMMTYIQCHFCNSMVDPDLFLIQQLAAKLNPDWFIQTVFKRFHVWDWFSMENNNDIMYRSNFLDPDQMMSILEGSLIFLATIFSVRTNLGATKQENLRKEMIALLAMINRTHSKLNDLLPEKCGTSQNIGFEEILEDIATYREPTLESSGNLTQGMYSPKYKVWENEYDPLFVLLRAVHRKDYQTSLDRFVLFAKHRYKTDSSINQPWPPFRIPSDPDLSKFLDPRKVLYSKVLHGVIFTILYKAVHICDIPDQILALTIFILEMALRYPVPDDLSPVLKLDNKTVSATNVQDTKFDEWFESDSILVNMNHVIQNISFYDRSGLGISEDSGPSVEEMDIDWLSGNVEEAEDAMSIYMSGEYYNPPSPEIQSLSTTSSSSAASSSSTALLPASTMTFQSMPERNFTHNSNQYNSRSVALRNSDQYTVADDSRVLRAMNAINQFLFDYKMANFGRGLRQTPSIQSREVVISDFPLLDLAEYFDSSQDQLSQVTDLIQALPSYDRLKLISINESIISLLLKLHSKLSGIPDSYKPGDLPSNSRIGDGTHFVKLVLDLYCNLNVSSGIKSIEEWRKKIWPNQSSGPNIDGSPEQISDKSEKRRKARERQQRLMAEFAWKQNAFLKKINEKNLEDTSEENCELLKSKSAVTDKTYECIICSQSSPSLSDGLMGTVVLLQPTSVLGHSIVNKADDEVVNRLKLKCTDEEAKECKERLRLSHYVDEKIDDYALVFDSSSWLFSLNIGWEGGVHVQSCGHYVHLECHKSYIIALRDASQTNRNSVDLNEFYCPLCRQLANSALPINPTLGQKGIITPHMSLKSNDCTIVFKIHELMDGLPLDKNLMEQFNGFCQDLTKATSAQYRTRRTFPSEDSLCSFMCSIIRTNLECDLLVKMTKSTPAGVRKDCFVALFHALALHAQILLNGNRHMIPLWEDLTGLPVKEAISEHKNNVPLLLRDPISLLILIMFKLPLNVGKIFYTTVIKALFDLTMVQSLVQLSFLVVKASDSDLEDLNHVRIAFQQHHSSGFFEMFATEKSSYRNWSEEKVKKTLKDLCLPFLRISALFQSHLYDEGWPEVKENEDEFLILSKFLGLKEDGSFNDVYFPTRKLIFNWVSEYCWFLKKSFILGKKLMQERPLSISRPSLLKLPQTYDELFLYYQKVECNLCRKVPKEPCLCLVCGTLICMKDSCCRQNHMLEAVSHSQTCGAGTAIYLAVNSSAIIVIRGKRACIWGSIYLDVHGEEDKDLKRGKPLFLYEPGLASLEQQWLTHSFDHTSKRWVNHKNDL